MCVCGSCFECHNRNHAAVMQMEAARQAEMAASHIGQVQFHTPVANFEAHWDNIHEHSSPQHHGGASHGAKMHQTDLDTGKTTLSYFDVNVG